MSPRVFITGYNTTNGQPGGTPGQDWILLSSRLLWSCGNENRVLALGINGTYKFPKVFNMTLKYKDLLPARMSASSMN